MRTAAKDRSNCIHGFPHTWISHQVSVFDTVKTSQLSLFFFFISNCGEHAWFGLDMTTGPCVLRDMSKSKHLCVIRSHMTSVDTQHDFTAIYGEYFKTSTFPLTLYTYKTSWLFIGAPVHLLHRLSPQGSQCFVKWFFIQYLITLYSCWGVFSAYKTPQTSAAFVLGRAK